VLELGFIAVTVLAANSAARLRRMAGSFFLVALAADLIGSRDTSPALIAVAACAGLAAAAILYIAARDDEYGEDPGWRLWVATIVAAAATSAAYAAFRTTAPTGAAPTLFGEGQTGAVIEVASFWLLSSGVAIMLTAQGAVRGTLGALLMTTGVQLLLRLSEGPHLSLSLFAAWLQVIVALAGAFLIVNERAVRDR